MTELQEPVLKLLSARSIGAETATLVALLRFDRPNLQEHQVRTALGALHRMGKVTRDRRHGASWRVAT